MNNYKSWEIFLAKKSFVKVCSVFVVEIVLFSSRVVIVSFQFNKNRNLK